MSSGHAPVSTHALRLEGHRIAGYAAPAAGMSPCLLRLDCAGETIAIARAARFSGEALSRGLRLGWCGVALAGLHLAAAIGDSVSVHCVASGRELLRADLPVAQPAPPPEPRLDLFALLAHARRDESCDDPAHILPFAIASYRGGDIPALLAATYRSLLQREPDDHVVAAWQAATPAQPVHAAINMILTAPEYLDDPRHFIPGPFHPAFAFDLTPLDG